MERARSLAAAAAASIAYSWRHIKKKGVLIISPAGEEKKTPTESQLFVSTRVRLATDSPRI